MTLVLPRPVLSIAIVLGGCAVGGTKAPATPAIVADSAGITVVTLATSPNAAARSASPLPATVVRRVVGSSIGLRTAAAITEMTGGRLAVLDRAGGRIVVLDSLGSLLWHVGTVDRLKPVQDVLSIAGRGDSIVILRGSEAFPLEVRAPDGAVVRAGGWKIANQWPSLLTEGPRWQFGGGFESIADPARFMKSAGQFLLVEAEVGARSGVPGRAALLRVASDLQSADTISVLSEPVRITAVGRNDRHDRFLFGARTLWDASDNLIAITDGRRPEIAVFQDGRITMLVRWRAGRHRVRGRDHVNAAAWFTELTLSSDTMAAAYARRLSRKEMTANTRRIQARLPFDSIASEASTLVTLGSCVLVGGWNSDDAINGASGSLIAIAVPSGSVLGVVRIPSRGARVRASGRQLHTASIDSLGGVVVESFALPWPECRGGGREVQTLITGGQHASHHLASSSSGRAGHAQRRLGEVSLR